MKAKTAKAKPRTAQPLQVFKFGGVAVGTPEAVRIAAGHVAAAAPRVAVIVSAMAGVTDMLLAGLQIAATGRRGGAAAWAAEFEERHLHLVHALITRRSDVRILEDAVRSATREYNEICASVRVLRELTTQTRDTALA